jgi:hypothetical protein
MIVRIAKVDFWVSWVLLFSQYIGEDGWEALVEWANLDVLEVLESPAPGN